MTRMKQVAARAVKPCRRARERQSAPLTSVAGELRARRGASIIAALVILVTSLTLTEGYMPHWVRHTQSSTTVGSFWNEKTNPVIVDNCTPSEQATLQSQFDLLRANPGINAFPALRDAMLAMWPGMRI